MSFSRAVGPVFGASCVLMLLASACGSSSGSNVNGGGTGKAGSSTGPNLGNLAGNGSSSGGSSGDPGCASDLVKAERIPLDMYVMLDVSGSMTEATAGDVTITKWDAVSSALSEFVKDPASAGMGMGLQVFPIVHPDAPASCKSNNDCGEFGPCFLKACWGYDEALVPCETDAYCGRFGPCIEFAQCAGNREFVCAAEDIGLNCGTDPMTGQQLGACSALVSSTCLSTADCRPATYATPATPIAELPGAQAALVAAIEAAGPEDGGLTPSGPALQGAIDQASSWAVAHPDRQVVAVLATDGLPTLCEPVEIAAVAALAARGRGLKPAVSTFVIGVVGPTDVDAPTNLDSIAKSGGTTKAFIVDTAGDVQKQFRDALNTIRASGLSCELAVPSPMDGKALDYGFVNVTFDRGDGPTNLIGVADETGCTAEGGWYYDVNPDEGTPKRIVACPTTCTQFQQTDMGSVQIKLGCEETRVK
ncbi:MAG TPA: VWA domain-containing protein [Polyangiaceae bacterium]|nr:VWA domain-containing protein [Polyangiaceae bacterium]